MGSGEHKDNCASMLQATAQAAIEAHIMLQRFSQLHEYTITVRTPYCGMDVIVDRNHQVKISLRSAD